MAVTIYSGLPGTGKTASSTYYAVKTYKKQNSKLVLFIRYLKQHTFKELKSFNFKPFNLDQFKQNNIYSNYPILLDIKNNIYSYSVKPNDLLMNYQFPKQSLIILDETQRYFDSREFKTFPKDLGTFLQHHRHTDILNIVLVTQHPRRLDNKMRDLSEIFRKYRLFVKIPFIPIILTTYTNYYEFDDYGKYHHVKREMRTYDYDNHLQIMFVNNVFTRYNSKYFSIIFEDLPQIKNKEFNQISLTKDQINDIGIQLK